MKVLTKIKLLDRIRAVFQVLLTIIPEKQIVIIYIARMSAQNPAM